MSIEGFESWLIPANVETLTFHQGENGITKVVATMKTIATGEEWYLEMTIQPNGIRAIFGSDAE